MKNMSRKLYNFHHSTKLDIKLNSLEVNLKEREGNTFHTILANC